VPAAPAQSEGRLLATDRSGPITVSTKPEGALWAKRQKVLVLIHWKFQISPQCGVTANNVSEGSSWKKPCLLGGHK
jgi:hypothetical protein